MSAPPPPVLALRGVRRVHASGVLALDGVDLVVGRGEFLAVVGPSGSGKSTLLNVMGTLDRPTGGSVHLDGVDVAGLPDRHLARLRARRLGFVFQQADLVDALSAVDNVATALLYAGVPRRDRRARALRALDRVGLAARAGHLPGRLSGGERQRVAIARALVNSPALILADEPTGALDSASGAAVLELLRTLHAQGSTIAVITHDRDIARALPRRVEVRDGRIVSDGPGGGR